MMPVAALRLRAAAGGGPGVHRYWRLYITANDGSTSFIGLTELRLKDASGVVRSESTASTLPYTASSFVNASNIARNAFDTNLVNSGWLAANATPPAWVKVDTLGHGSLSGPFECKSFDIYGSHNAPSASPKDFELQWSDDNVNWTTAKAVVGQTGWAANELRTFSVP